MRDPRNAFIVSVLIFFILLFGGVILLYHEQLLSAKITVNAVPIASNITINGRAAKNGVNRVRPGTQRVTVTFVGFTAITQTVSVKKGEGKTVDAVLVSNSSQTSNWYFTHPEDERKAEGLSSQTNDTLAAKARKETPLIQYLPFVAGGFEYRVDYGTLPGSKNSLPVIYITAPTAQAQQDAIKWIKSLGYNPNDYTIKFVTAPVSPLNSE